MIGIEPDTAVDAIFAAKLIDQVGTIQSATTENIVAETAIEDIKLSVVHLQDRFWKLCHQVELKLDPLASPDIYRAGLFIQAQKIAVLRRCDFQFRQ